MLQGLKTIFSQRWVPVLIIIALLAAIGYMLFFRTITITPQSEAKRMEQLALTKQTAQISPFVSDGCSGGVSSGWMEAMNQLEQLPIGISEQYTGLESIPFETACVDHDRVYHRGDGGYRGRLKSDNELRTAIMQYGITNVDQITQRHNLSTAEQAIYLYEVIAEAVYRGVRLGGAPCTGQSYAWGYGYNAGHCTTTEQ